MSEIDDLWADFQARHQSQEQGDVTLANVESELTLWEERARTGDLHDKLVYGLWRERTGQTEPTTPEMQRYLRMLNELEGKDHAV
jgi:hypothetical protein